MKYYKDFPKSSGIYCYENKINNKKYVGLAVNIYERVRQHETNFNKDTYTEVPRGENFHLWNSVKKYGRENFTSYVVELCEREMLNEREIYHIKNLKSHITENGYNVAWGGFTRLGVKATEEHKEKMSKGLRGLKRTEETKKKISDSHKGENHYNFGKHLSDEIKNKIKNSHIGSNNHMFNKIGENNPNYGHKNKNCSSQYFGVYKLVRGKTVWWRAQINLNKRNIGIGNFRTEIEAAKAYDKYVIENNLNRKLNFS